MTRVCLYTRISTDEVNQPTSLHSQRERLEAFCRAQEGWRIVAHHEDRQSGATLTRSGLEQALELARDRRIDLLLVYRVDRLSRKVRQLAQLAEELDDYGVALRSATEPFDTGSAAGRMMLQMLAVFAEFEHATIVDRVSAGIERRAKEGRWATGRLPFGYCRNEQKQVVPDEHKAAVVRRTFELYAAGRLGTAAIARKLAAEQAPSSPRGWQPAVVQWVLANDAYLGKVHWRGESYPGLHEPLVDELTFARAQRLLLERGEDMALRRSNPGNYLLSGLLRCGRCRRAYVGMSAKGNGGRYHYYACSGRQKLGPKGCEGDRIPRDKLEEAVLHQLAGLYRDGVLIRRALSEAERREQQDRPALEERRQALAREIRRTQHALERYYAAFEAGGLDPARFEHRVSALDARLATLTEQDSDLGQRLAPQACTAPDAAALAAVADQLERTIAEADPKQAKALLRLLIKELKVNGRSEILPTYRVVTPEVCALPSSVEIAEPGSTFAVGERAFVRYAGLGAKLEPTVNTTLGVTVQKVDEGSASDIEGLGESTVPYYVHVEYENHGEAAIDANGPGGRFTIRGSDGEEYDTEGVISIGGEFDACPGADARATLAAEEAITDCVVITLKKGVSPQEVRFEGDYAAEQEPIGWKVE